MRSEVEVVKVAFACGRSSEFTSARLYGDVVPSSVFLPSIDVRSKAYGDVDLKADMVFWKMGRWEQTASAGQYGRRVDAG